VKIQVEFLVVTPSSVMVGDKV